MEEEEIPLIDNPSTSYSADDDIGLPDPPQDVVSDEEMMAAYNKLRYGKYSTQDDIQKRLDKLRGSSMSNERLDNIAIKAHMKILMPDIEYDPTRISTERGHLYIDYGGKKIRFTNASDKNKLMAKGVITGDSTSSFPSDTPLTGGIGARVSRNEVYEKAFGMSYKQYEEYVPKRNTRTEVRRTKIVQDAIEQMTIVEPTTPAKRGERIDKLKEGFQYLKGRFGGENLRLMSKSAEYVPVLDQPLPDREIMALDDRLKTIDGQIAVALSKMEEANTNMEQLLNGREKSELTPQELTIYNRHETVYETQNELYKGLKGDYMKQLDKMKYYRDAILGVSGGVIASLLAIIAGLLGKSALANIAESAGGGSGGGGGGGDSPNPPPSPEPKPWYTKIKEFLVNLLKKLGVFFLDQLKKAASATMKAFWNLMYNTIQFLIKNVWLLITAIAGFLAYEVSKILDGK